MSEVDSYTKDHIDQLLVGIDLPAVQQAATSAAAAATAAAASAEEAAHIVADPNDGTVSALVKEVGSATQIALSVTTGLVFPIGNYGTVDTTGATDSSPAINAAIQACYAAGGGIVRFPAGKIRWDDSPMIPNSSTDTSVGVQPTISLVGEGAIKGNLTGSGMSAGIPGTILIMGATTGPAQLDTRGSGILVIDKLTFSDPNPTNPIPFIQATNTLLTITDNVAFWGAPTLTGTACNKDAIVLGGTEAGSDPDNTAASFFQGYGTVIGNVYFSNIRRGLDGKNAVNAVKFDGGVWSYTCGGDENAAAIELNGAGLDTVGNLFLNPIIEMQGYVYGVRLGPHGKNTFINPGFFDPLAQAVAEFYLFGGSSGNLVVGGFHALPTSQLMASDGNASNRLFAQIGSAFMGTAGTFENGLNVVGGSTVDEQHVVGTGPGQWDLLDQNPVNSAVIWQIGSAGHGYWTFANAGAGTTRRQLVGYDSTGVARIIFDPSTGFIFDTATGMKIGTAATQKLSFWGAMPIVQPARAGQLTDSSGGTSGGATVPAVTDFPSAANAIATLTAKINALEAKLSAAGGGVGITA